MAKSSGLGDNLFIDEFEVGGDIGALDRIACPMAVQEVPGITMSAQDRLGLKHDGGIDFTAWFNPDATVGAEGAHAVLSTLPTADRLVTYCRGTAIGSPAASEVTKQIDYNADRTADGGLTFKVTSQANGFGLEWGQLVTAGPRTDTAATSPATGVDLGAASYSFGWSAYLHVKAFTGTSATITLQDSANNSAFTSLTGGAFASVTGATKERIAGAADALVREYVRVITTGTFSELEFVVNFIRHEQAAS